MRTSKDSSKAMEADLIVQMVLNFPKIDHVYMRNIVTDNDATTPSNLEEDTGPKSSSHIPKHLTGILVLANPSHHKYIVGNAYYDLIQKIAKVS